MAQQRFDAWLAAAEGGEGLEGGTAAADAENFFF